MKMLPLSDYSEFKKLYETAKNNIGKPDTNCLFPGTVVKDGIRQEILYYRVFPEGLVLFLDEGNLYRVYYFLDSSKPIPDLSCGKTLLIEELDNNNRREEYLNSFAEKLTRSGFYLESRNIQFEINLAEKQQWIRDEYARALHRIESNGFSFTVQPDHEQAEQVLEIWKNNLKPTDVPLSHTRFETDDEQSVVCVVDRDGRVCGTLWWINRGNYCEIRHIVTHPDHYRKGISNFTMLYSFMRASENGSKIVISYMDVHNENSILMHKRAGMTQNGKVSLQFILEAEEKKKE